jgi:hypothetical protein
MRHGATGECVNCGAMEMQHGLSWLPMNIQMDISAEMIILVLLVLIQRGDMSLSRQFNSQNL